MAGREQELRAFGYRVSTQRTELGISQEKLAELCDLSKTAIGNLESGLSEPKLLSLKNLSSVLKCSSDFLLFGYELPERDATADQLLSLVKEAQGKLEGSKLEAFVTQSRSLIDPLAKL